MIMLLIGNPPGRRSIQMIFLSGTLFILLFYAICICCLLCNARSRQLISKVVHSFTPVSLFLFLAVLIIPTALIVYWSRQDHCIYYWDFAGYWSSSINQMHFMRSHSLIECISNVHRSINYVPYNTFLSSVIALPLHILGYSFRKYVLINCLLFFLPTVVVTGLICSELYCTVCPSFARPDRAFVIGCLVAVLVPVCYYPILRGYIDVAFLLPSSAVLFHIIDIDFEHRSYREDILSALALILIWVSRRYAVYLVIGLATVMVFQAVRRSVNSRHAPIRKALMPLMHVALTGAVSLGILLLFFPHFVSSAVGNNYAETYSAYDASFIGKASSLLSSYGLITVIMAAAAAVICLVKKQNSTAVISLLLIAVIETALFWKTQDMDIHHRMLLYLPVTAILCMGVLTDCLHDDDKPLRRRVITGICTTCLALNLIIVFLPLSLRRTDGNSSVIFAAEYQPIQRDDIEQIEELTDYLRLLTQGTKDSVYIAASSDILNADIIRKVKMPDTDVALENLLGTSDVDLRDGFPAAFPEAEYVVCTDPVQTHLPAGQEVIRYINDNVMDHDSVLGKHYRELVRFRLDRDVTAVVFRKETQYSEADLDVICDYFTDLYPGKEALFSDRIIF